MKNTRTDTVEKCAHCHLFIEENEDRAPDIARYVHLDRGDEADEAITQTHEATPSGEAHSLAYWKEHGPDAMRARFE